MDRNKGGSRDGGKTTGNKVALAASAALSDERTSKDHETVSANVLAQAPSERRNHSNKGHSNTSVYRAIWKTRIIVSTSTKASLTNIFASRFYSL